MIAFALQLGHAERDDVLALGHFALGVIEHLALEKHDWVVIADRRLEQTLRVSGSAGSADLESRNVGEPALPRLRVLRRKL